ncbi:MAG: hypothetical protein AAGL89_02295 [Pseudomonadota bacterium]
MTETEFNDFLVRISTPFISGDFEAWEACIHLPLALVTQSGPVTLYDRDDLRKNFDLYIQATRIMGLTEVFRTPVSIEDCDDGTFIVTYRTELLSNGTRRTNPYTSSALVLKIDGTWRLNSIMNARGHHDWTGHHPHKPGE